MKNNKNKKEDREDLLSIIFIILLGVNIGLNIANIIILN